MLDSSIIPDKLCRAINIEDEKSKISPGVNTPLIEALRTHQKQSPIPIIPKVTSPVE